MGATSERAVPILPSRDLHESLTFYERLGFENRGAPPEAWGYLILGRGEIELHLLGEPNAFPELSGPASCYLMVADADALYAEWSSSGVEVEAPVTSDYGMREFMLRDPSGNLLRVGSMVGS